MNNQFSGPNAWDDYLTTLEQATPVIEAIAVTDFCVTDWRRCGRDRMKVRPIEKQERVACQY